jgi:hypothetical protein
MMQQWYAGIPGMENRKKSIPQNKSGLPGSATGYAR